MLPRFSDAKMLTANCMPTYMLMISFQVCKPEDVQWFQTSVGATLTMKVDGPHVPGDGETI